MKLLQSHQIPTKEGVYIKLISNKQNDFYQKYPSILYISYKSEQYAKYCSITLLNCMIKNINFK